MRPRLCEHAAARFSGALPGWGAVVAAMVMMTAILGGCASDQAGLFGYGAEPLHDTEISNIAVNIAGNRTFYQGVEFDVTEALTKEIELRTPYKVVDENEAQTLLTATITSVNQGVLSRTIDGGLPQETQVTITISFEWRDLRTGEWLRRRSAVSGTGEYLPGRSVGEHRQIAEHTAASEVAREVVSIMRADW